MPFYKIDKQSAAVLTTKKKTYSQKLQNKRELPQTKHAKILIWLIGILILKKRPKFKKRPKTVSEETDESLESIEAIMSETSEYECTRVFRRVWKDKITILLDSMHYVQEMAPRELHHVWRLLL